MFGVLLPIAAFVTGGVRAQHRQHVLHAGRSADLGRTRRYRSCRTRGRRRGAISLGPGVFANLIPVTLGNIVGGVLVGLPSRAVHLREDEQVDETT